MFITNGPYVATGSRIGLPAEDEHLEGLRLRQSCARVGGDGDDVAGAEHGELTTRSERAVGRPPDGAGAAEDVDQGVEVAPPGQRQLAPGCDRGVDQRDRRVRDPGPACPPTSPAITRTQRAAVVRRTAAATFAAVMSW